LDACEESPYYSDRERVGRKAVTNIRDGNVRDEVYEIARKHFSEKELTDLTLAVAAIKAWNRLAISEPGRISRSKAIRRRRQPEWTGGTPASIAV
jgi:hypothetical protein